MFQFKLEPDISLLTVTRTGLWSLETVISYEKALRIELAKLRVVGRPRLVIIDTRSRGAQPSHVADALRSMVARLGPLHADRTAVVTATELPNCRRSGLPIPMRKFLRPWCLPETG